MLYLNENLLFVLMFTIHTFRTIITFIDKLLTVKFIKSHRNIFENKDLERKKKMRLSNKNQVPFHKMNIKYLIITIFIKHTSSY